MTEQHKELLRWFKTQGQATITWLCTIEDAALLMVDPGLKKLGVLVRATPAAARPCAGSFGPFRDAIERHRIPIH